MEGVVFHIEQETPRQRNGIRLVQVGIQVVQTGNLDQEQVYTALEDRTRLLLTETVQRNTVVTPAMNNVGFYVEGRSDVDNAIVANDNQVVFFRDITAGLFEGLFERVLYSQTDVQLENITWYFTLDPNNLLGGGATKVTRPAFVRQKWMYSSWVGYEEVGCAAFAIASTIQHSINRNNRPELLMRRALEIQEKMQWERILVPGSVLDFVDEYKDYALGILCSHLITNPISNHFYREGENYDFEADKETGFKKRIYIYLDTRQNHYGCIDKLALANPTRTNSSSYTYTYWCNHCHCAHGFNHREKHLHGEPAPKRQKTEETPVQKTCRKCAQVYLSTTRHLCPTYECKICKSFQKRSNKNNGHRCPLLPSDFKLPKKQPVVETEAEEEDDEEIIEFATTEAQLDKGYFCLFAYDFESCIDIKQRKTQQIVGFEMNENGQYKIDQDGNPVLKTVDGMDFTLDYSHHRVNLVCYKNVFFDKPAQTIKDFSLVDTKKGLIDFINFALDYNHGNNIFYAHNASGYDSRLLFQAMKELNLPVEIAPVTRGGKFIQITVSRWVRIEGERKKSKTIFRDSMLHLGGSLKSLAFDFCEDVGLEKGHFPHLFNKAENFGYVGSLPPLASFDFTFSAKSAKDLQEAIQWWNERNGQGPWSFEQEIIKYCVNDVDILAEIMKKFHEITVAWFKYSPWYFLLI